MNGSRTLRLLRCGGLLLLLCVSARAEAQVAVAPTFMFTSDREQFGTFAVHNASAVPQEVVIEFRFGYPRSDSLGNRVMEYDDSVTAGRYSLDAYTQAFPRRFVVAPGEDQIVRIAVRPPAGLPDGTYWTRVVTTSTPQVDAIDTVTSGVAARVVMRLQHVTTLSYRQGAVESGVRIGEPLLDTRAEPRLIVPLEQTGNSPFLGMLQARVLDERDRAVATTERSVAVYFDAVEHLPLEIPALPPGRYRVELAVRPGRPDVAPEHTVRGPVVVRQAAVERR